MHSFFSQRTYWCGTSPNSESDINESTPLLSTNSETRLSWDSVEKEPVGLATGVKIRKLTKVPTRTSKNF